MDIDLDQAEALFNQQANQGLENGSNGDIRDDKDEKKSKKKKHHKSKSRSRSNKKKSKKKHSSRSRSRSGKKSKKHRSRSSKKDKKHHHSSERKTEEKQSQEAVSKSQEARQLTSVERIEQKKRELEQQIEKLNKDAEDAAREDLTVMIYQLPSKADEKDIWRYLTKHCGASKVRDIKLIRDQKTKKSKGVSYAEFYIKEDVDKALAADTKPFFLKGEEVPMSEVRIQHSQAEKNRAALAAREIKRQRAEALKEQLAKLQEGPVKVFVGGLNGKLADMTEQDLKDIFQKYGDIESVELPVNVQGKCLGFGYLTFKKKSDAHEAIKMMNGFKLEDQKISVTPVAVNLSFAPVQPLFPSNIGGAQTQDNIDLDQNENKVFLHSAAKKLELMKKLAGNSTLSVPGTEAAAQPTVSAPLPIPGIANLPSLNIAQNPLVQNNFMAGNRPPTSLLPTNYIVLVNMFAESDFKNDPSFFADLKEDVSEECKKYGDVVEVFVAIRSPCGSVFVLFNDAVGAVTCAKNMDGRMFNGRPISSYCISEDTLQDELQEHL
ncbi:hypothetical protein ABPG74_020675 [Tetrahymena malaccensis]